MFKEKKKYTLSELSYRCGLGEDDALDVESECQPFSPSPSWLISPRGTPLPPPAGFSRSLRHILSPHLSQHIKLSVLPQLHTRRCCHAKHRSARTPDCCRPARRGVLLGRWGDRTSVQGAPERLVPWIIHSISLGNTPRIKAVHPNNKTMCLFTYYAHVVDLV